VTVEEWDGRGLPPVARARIDHAAECLIVGNAISRFGRSSGAVFPAPAVILSDRGVPGWRRRGMTER
jgi:hypothetical protein